MNDKNIPEAALRCGVGLFELGDNGEDAKTSPFRMVARSGDAIDHWYWGKVVHDLSGMQLKGKKVAIDYAHDENQIIGFANHFDIEDGNLNVSGALTPYKEQDRASEVAYKAKQGVPYEASINFAGDGIAIEEFGEGDEVEVNGRLFSGPLTVVREWPLRGIAVCPYGADGNTSTSFSNEETIKVRIMSKETKPEEKPEELTAAVVEVEEAQPEAVDAEAVEAAEVLDSETVDATADAEAVEVVEEVAVAEFSGPQFLERFGDIGGVWFAQGKTWEECLQLHEDALQERIENLEAQLAIRSEGEETPVEFSATDAPTTTRGGLENKIKGMLENK